MVDDRGDCFLTYNVINYSFIEIFMVVWFFLSTRSQQPEYVQRILLHLYYYVSLCWWYAVCCALVAGFFGANCDRQCPQHCAGGRCHRIFGYCECLPGLFGAACNQPCPAGTWGPNCIHMCNCSLFQHASGCDPKVWISCLRLYGNAIVFSFYFISINFRFYEPIFCLRFTEHDAIQHSIQLFQLNTSGLSRAGDRATAEFRSNLDRFQKVNMDCSIKNSSYT